MIHDKQQILQLIKKTVHDIEPTATVILYGSYARDEERENSDIDLLILLDTDKARISWGDSKKIFSSIGNIEMETSKVIVPMIYSKKKWANHRITPFYENVKREGILL